jgi:nicotinate-nucleotide--dimethylbenzimidazole phosphoribosyltransferase
MVAALTGGTAAINVLARQAGASLTVVDVGVVAELDPAPTLLARKVRRGTADLAVGPAMTGAEANRALDVGTEIAARLVAGGARALVTGEVGIANTTAAAAVIAAFTGRPAGEVTGRGCGVDDATLARKLTAVESALVRTGAAIDPLEVLVSLGGLEIAALAGFIAGGAAARVPVVIDGVTTLAALLVATSMVPEVLGYCIAGHRSPEPGAAAVLDRLGLSPVVDLSLRLGEGTGACLALPTLEAAAAVLAEMATLEEAGVACAAPPPLS